MRITVVGKEKKEKTQKDGSLTVNMIVHGTCKRAKVEGQGTESVYLFCSEYPYDSIQIGKTYEFERNAKGFVQDFCLV